MVLNILILGGWSDNSFGIFRALSNINKYNLYVADYWPLAAIGYSKFTKKFYKLPYPATDSRYATTLIKLCKKTKIDVILPTLHEEMIAVSYNKQKFLDNKINLSVPDYELIELAIDKYKLSKHARKHKIAQPLTFLLSETDPNKIFDNAEFPLIIKLKAKTGQIDQKIVYNKKDCLIHLNKLTKKYKSSEILIQEYIPGLPLDTMYTTGLLYDKKHKLKLVVPTKKIREIPYTGGTGMCVKSENHKPTIKFCTKLMDSFKKWEGISDIETKIDPRDGKVKLIEINPRPWGPNYNLYVSGVNLADLWIKTAINEDFPSITDFKENTYTTTVGRDILMFLDTIPYLFSKNWKNALRVLKTYKYPYCCFYKQSISADFVLNDIKPFFIYLKRIRKKILIKMLPNFLAKYFTEH